MPLLGYKGLAHYPVSDRDLRGGAPSILPSADGSRLRNTLSGATHTEHSGPDIRGSHHQDRGWQMAQQMRSDIDMLSMSGRNLVVTLKDGSRLCHMLVVLMGFPRPGKGR
jgi:hypothetical protein